MATANGNFRREPTSELVRRVVNDLQELIDKQVELAKQELREQLHEATSAGKQLGIGAGLLAVAGICFFFFLFLGIDTLWPRWGWLAALLLTIVFGAVGGLLVARGRHKVALRPLARTRATLKEDAEWAKHRLVPSERSSTSETRSPEPSLSSNVGHEPR